MSVGNYFSAGCWGGVVRQIVHDHQVSVKTGASGQGVFLKVGLMSASAARTPLGHRVFFHSAKKPSVVRDCVENILTQRYLEELFGLTVVDQLSSEHQELERLISRSKKTSESMPNL